ncbi:AMP-binding protein [Sphingomonas sp.]|uniref:AMP-binding protein n=1 Tax=Sphingomonas sp. TaxID=28214 RepID=UPI00262034CE|nr:AMP-binding protein [Sphingomonas sp.]MDF2495956.1 acyl-CoA synthase [Sphingomonas sp.]
MGQTDEQLATERNGSLPAVDLAACAALAQRGLLFSYWARRQPELTAIHSARGDRTFGELNANANRVLAVMRQCGLSTGSRVAVLCGNIPEFVEVMLACQRGGLRFTPINWHLAPDEIAYIVRDSRADALVIDAPFAEKLSSTDLSALGCRLSVGETTPGFRSYASALGEHSGTDPVDAAPGGTMLYTSGTTGRPKGVIKPAGPPMMPLREGSTFGYRDGDVNLLCGPAYHGGPMAFDLLFPLSSGAAIVMMERFEPENALELIATHRVTHTHMVATMFQRLLALPEQARGRHDLSSLRMLIHGAAPTPPAVKRAMIDWLGPILWEYYAATEIATRINITSEEWLRKPGSVGKLPIESGATILDDEDAPCPVGVTGRICFPNTNLSARYHNAPDKNGEVFGGAYFTIGDIGYVDEDGYLFLTGRSAETIISGGVNIYPQEVDNVLMLHPAVQQSCTVGVPDDEWGEAVRGVVALAPGYAPSPAIENELIEFARGRVAHYKVPRRIDFVGAIAESAAGKVLRSHVRDQYWRENDRAI